MKLIDFETIINDYDEETFYIVGAQLFEINDRFLLVSFLELLEIDFIRSTRSQNPYIELANTVEYYLNNVFINVRSSKSYKAKVFRITESMKDGNGSIDDLESLVKIFISFARCSSSHLSKGYSGTPTSLPATEPFECVVKPSDAKLIEDFAKYHFKRSVSKKNFLGKRKNFIEIASEHCTFLSLIIILIYYRVMQFEGLINAGDFNS